MVTPLPIAPPRQARHVPSTQSADSMKLVAVASGVAHAGISQPAPAVSFRLRAFGANGLLWADKRWWEIDPIGGDEVDEARAGAAFCAAWVVARRFLEAPAAKALSCARSAAANSILNK